jgi:hypothetical protein
MIIPLKKWVRVMEHDIPAIVAETAVMYFKQRFRTKEWDGTPWPPTKRPVKRGSLMVRTGKLVNSIRPKKVTKTEVVISAGTKCLMRRCITKALPAW